MKVFQLGPTAIREVSLFLTIPTLDLYIHVGVYSILESII